MPHANRSSLMMFSVVAALTLCGGIASTQDEVQPTNDLPNPYPIHPTGGKTPGGKALGSLNGVDIDRDGKSIWVADRCGPNPHPPPGASAFQYDSCAGSTLPPVLKFDSSG